MGDVFYLVLDNNLVLLFCTRYILTANSSLLLADPYYGPRYSALSHDNQTNLYERMIT